MADWNLNSGLSDGKTIPTILDCLNVILGEFDFDSEKNEDSNVFKRKTGMVKPVF